MRRKWNLRNGASLSSQSDSSDDGSPEEGFNKDHTLEALPENDDSTTPSPFMSKGARKASELLKALDEFNTVSREREAREQREAVPEKEIAALEPPVIAAESDTESSAESPEEESVPMQESKAKEKPAPKRKEPVTLNPETKEAKYRRTVQAIYDFFQGEFSIQVILQAIHACAGDYRAATVKLSQGFTGCSILEIPTVAGDVSRTALRTYLRGDEM